MPAPEVPSPVSTDRYPFGDDDIVVTAPPADRGSQPVRVRCMPRRASRAR
jgi:hypothetical protein